MIYYLVDALPALLGSMATVWAVCSRRHWFVRSCFLVALLLLFLLIPAYELLIAGCVQITVISLGIMWWRKKRNPQPAGDPNKRRWQISLGSVLLLTVLIAVTMATLASFPAAPWLYWVRWTGPGFIAGCATLFAMWLVLGQVRWPIRLMIAITFVFLTATAISVINGLSWVTRDWTRFSAAGLRSLFSEQSVAYMSSLFEHYLSVMALGMGLLCVWLVLLLKTGWFDPFGNLVSNDSKSSPSRFKTSIRMAWIALTVLIAILPVTLLLKCALPREQSKYVGLKPASFALFYEVANKIDKDTLQLLKNFRSLSNDDLKKELAKHDVALEQMRKALSMPTTGSLTVKEDKNLPWALLRFLNVHKHLAQNLQSIDKLTEIHLDLLKFNNFWYLDAGMLGSTSVSTIDASYIQELWNLRSQLTSDQRHEIVTTLAALEVQREDWHSIQHRQRVADANSSWLLHLHQIMDGWLGYDRHWEMRIQYLTNRAKLRLLMLDLAVMVYREANGNLPDSLSNLVPSVLNELPIDPYGNGSLKYRRTDDGYTLYSVGPNGTDEDGENDDLLLDELMQPAKPSTP
jgi:hypothetical protein